STSTSSSSSSSSSTSSSSTSSSSSSSTSVTTTSSTSTSTILAVCGCGSPDPHFVAVKTVNGAGTCGDVKLDNGSSALTLNLDELNIGGGSSTQVPSVVPDYYLPAIFTAASCTPGNLTLTNATSGDTGSSRSCTSAGCSYGPPTPVVNTIITALSACVLNSLSANASGTLACSNGASNLNLPLSAATFGLGDVMFMRCGPLTPDPNNRGRVCNVDANCGGVAGSCVWDNGPGAREGQTCTR